MKYNNFWLSFLLVVGVVRFAHAQNPDLSQEITTSMFAEIEETPAPTECASDEDCDDSNPCTTNACSDDGSCVVTNADEGTICLEAVGDCDMPDVCDGNGNCLAKFAAEGTTCADAGAVGVCELPDVCDGSGNCLVKNAAEGTTCGDAKDGLCDAQDTCDGNGACVDRKASDGTQCGFEDGCSEANQCQEGLCICPIGGAATDDKPAADENPTGSSGGSYGDPHLKTWKGTVYDFHGACDLVLVKDSAFSAGAGLELHIRTTIRRDWSFVSAAALRIGDDVLEVRSRAAYYLNGVKSAKLPSSIGGYPITVKAHGQKRHRFKVNLHNNREILIKVYNEFLAVSVNNADDDFATSVGMMGSYETGELIARDGKTVVEDTNLFGFEWQVQQDDPILFLEPSGPQYPQSCDMPTVKAPKRRLSDDAMVSLEDAEKACESWPLEGRESCVYDVLATGDLEMAQAGAF